jgi:hypothetical protein
VFQSVLEPDTATNKVAFKLAGVLPGYVGLRGRIEPVGDTGDTVKVFFDRPVLSLCGCLNLRIGARARAPGLGGGALPGGPAAGPAAARRRRRRPLNPPLPPLRPPPRCPPRPAVRGAAGHHLPR